MSKLFWIRTFEKIDNETMQEVFVEPEQKLTLNGEQVKYCTVCLHWVPLNDFRDLCRRGFHEHSREIKLDDVEVDDRVGECLVEELKAK